MTEENQNPEKEEDIAEEEYDQEPPNPPQYYADFDESGNIAGFYVDTINDQIPESAIPISEEDWQTYIEASWKYRLGGDGIREKTKQELDDEAAARPPAPKTPLQE